MTQASSMLVPPSVPAPRAGAPARTRWPGRPGPLALALVVLGLLLWAKLLLVTNHPRTAVARPGATASVPTDGANQAHPTDGR